MKSHIKRLNRKMWRKINKFKDAPIEVIVSSEDFESFIKDARKNGLPVMAEHGFVTIHKKQKEKE